MLPPHWIRRMERHISPTQGKTPTITIHRKDTVPNWKRIE